MVLEKEPFAPGSTESSSTLLQLHGYLRARHLDERRDKPYVDRVRAERDLSYFP